MALSTSKTVTPATVRQWAREQGIESGFGTRGRLSASVLAAFLTANPKTARALAAERGVSLSSRKGRVSQKDAALLASNEV